MSAVYFVLLLGGLIFIHELGHFLVAKASGVRVLTFSIGFGPALLRKQWGDTEYKLAAVPLGGYVRMHGDEPDAEVPPEERDVAFNYKPLWKRTLIVLAGPVSNLILPFFVFFFMFMTFDTSFPAYVGTVTHAGPAWQAGIRPGDTVTAIDGEKVEHWWQLQQHVSGAIGKELDVTVQRGEETFTTTVVPEESEEVLLPHMNLVKKEGRIQVIQVYVEPLLGVDEGSRAWAAGLRDWDRVVRVNGEPVKTWPEVKRALEQPGEVTLDVLREEPVGLVGHAWFNTYGAPITVTVTGGEDLGVHSAEMVVHRVEEGTAAADIGLQPGDRILSMDGADYPLWAVMVKDLARNVDDTHEITWFDGTKTRTASFNLKTHTEKGEFNQDKKVVVFGAFNHSSINMPEMIPNQHRLAFALTQTWETSVDAFRVTFASVAGLVVGKVPVKELGGPILIYDMASRTEEHGWSFFFNLMAWLSISLGIINLFPIPILDGGHLVFFAIEAVIRRPVPVKVRQYAAYLGLVLILLLMVVVFYNDIARNWGTISGWF